MKKLYILIVILIVSYFSSVLNAQEELKRIAIYGIDLTELSESNINKTTLNQIPDYLVSFYANDERFKVIDLAKSQLIKNEQERQKAEEFLDGYVVAQGKHEGADYIFYTKYFKKDKEVSLRVYEVATNELFCESIEKVDLSFGMIKDLKTTSGLLVQRLNSSCFAINYPVVRSADKKSGKTVKKLLILAGRNEKIAKGYEFEILKKTIEKVGGRSFVRYEEIGNGNIDTIEDDNFSILSIKRGGDRIKAMLDANVELICKFKKR